MYIDLYRFRFVTVLQIFFLFFFRLLFSGSINDVILVFGGLSCVVGSRNLF